MSRPPPIRAVAVPGPAFRFVVDNLPGTLVQPSSLHGNGLFAARDLAEGEVLGTLDGQVVDWATFADMQRARPFGVAGDELFTEWNALAQDTLLVRPFRTKYGFINHSRTPNTELVRDPLRVVVIRAVSVGGELTLDYRSEPLRPEYLREATYL